MASVPTRPQATRCITLIVRQTKHAFRKLLMLLPEDVIYVLTLFAFWPTAILNLFLSWLCRRYHRRWDRINEAIVLGAAPLWHDDVHTLHRTERVTGVINCCREWNWHCDFYAREGIEQLHLPTIDFFPPSLEHCRRGVEFIRERAARGESVYVHCKVAWVEGGQAAPSVPIGPHLSAPQAGKGRSTTVVLCYLVTHEGMRCGLRGGCECLQYAPTVAGARLSLQLVVTPALSPALPQSPSSPAEADAYVRQRRPQISERWRTAPVIRMAEEASSTAPEAPRVAGVGSRAEFRSSRGPASGVVS